MLAEKMINYTEMWETEKAFGEVLSQVDKAELEKVKATIEVKKY